MSVNLFTPSRQENACALCAWIALSFASKRSWASEKEVSYPIVLVAAHVVRVREKNHQESYAVHTVMDTSVNAVSFDTVRTTTTKISISR